jgi:hypothetical protein
LVQGIGQANVDDIYFLGVFFEQIGERFVNADVPVLPQCCCPAGGYGIDDCRYANVAAIPVGWQMTFFGDESKANDGYSHDLNPLFN